MDPRGIGHQVLYYGGVAIVSMGQAQLSGGRSER